MEKATRENIEGFTQDSVEVVNQLLKQASEKNDYARMGKLQKMVQVLQEASAPSPEIAFVEQMLKENGAMVNQQFLDALSGLVSQMEAQTDIPEAKAMGVKLGEVYKIALKYSMKKNMG